MACELHAPRYIDLFRHHLNTRLSAFKAAEKEQNSFGRNREYIDRFLMELKDEMKTRSRDSGECRKEPQRPETQPEIPAQTPSFRKRTNRAICRFTSKR
ncbi:hypothetical protein PO124_00555 [Bacillus licheniformis]|nr:hypothetical protein [Bacillus licheniformis]